MELLKKLKKRYGCLSISSLVVLGMVMVGVTSCGFVDTDPADEEEFTGEEMHYVYGGLPDGASIDFKADYNSATGIVTATITNTSNKDIPAVKLKWKTDNNNVTIGSKREGKIDIPKLESNTSQTIKLSPVEFVDQYDVSFLSLELIIAEGNPKEAIKTAKVCLTANEKVAKAMKAMKLAGKKVGEVKTMVDDLGTFKKFVDATKALNEVVTLVKAAETAINQLESANVKKAEFETKLQEVRGRLITVAEKYEQQVSMVIEASKKSLTGGVDNELTDIDTLLEDPTQLSIVKGKLDEAENTLKEIEEAVNNLGTDVGELKEKFQAARKLVNNVKLKYNSKIAEKEKANKEKKKNKIVAEQTALALQGAEAAEQARKEVYSVLSAKLILFDKAEYALEQVVAGCQKARKARDEVEKLGVDLKEINNHVAAADKALTDAKDACIKKIAELAQRSVKAVEVTLAGIEDDLELGSPTGFKQANYKLHKAKAEVDKIEILKTTLFRFKLKGDDFKFKEDAEKRANQFIKEAQVRYNKAASAWQAELGRVMQPISGLEEEAKQEQEEIVSELNKNSRDFATLKTLRDRLVSLLHRVSEAGTRLESWEGAIGDTLKNMLHTGLTIAAKNYTLAKQTYNKAVQGLIDEAQKELETAAKVHQDAITKGNAPEEIKQKQKDKEAALTAAQTLLLE